MSEKWVQWINAGGTETKNIKNSLLTPPSYEVGGIAKRIKPLAFGEKPNLIGT